MAAQAGSFYPASEKEGELPGRLQQAVRCANPYCGDAVRLPGDFCRVCRGQQERQRTNLREARARG